MGQLFQELKRRNVIRVAIAYAVAAWLLIEVSATTFPMLRLPEWTATFVAVLLMIGFPIALIFSWAFELTPDGIKLEKHVVRDKSISHLTGRKLDFIIIAMLVVALGYFSYDKFVLDPGRDAELVQTTTEAVTEQVVETRPVKNADYSIAVLPFADLSPEGDHEYFSDGISEEILNVLAHIPNLHVTSRSSAFSFKGKSLDIPTVAAQLRVAYVLEGSVRKSGSRIRVTSQLIDASTDTQVWSESYDRDLEDVFVVQDEIAAAIVGALRERLELRAEAAPRVTAAANTDAHDAYLRGRHLVVRRSATAIEGAIGEFEKAVAIDPDYALAHAELAIAIMFLSNYGDLILSEAVARATPHIEQAMVLDSTLAEAHAAAGYAQRFQGNTHEALAHFRRAIQINPNYALVYNGIGVLLESSLGHYDEAFAAYETARRLDPLSIPQIVNHVRALIDTNRLAEADGELEKIASIYPARYAYLLALRTSVHGNWANLALGGLDAVRLEPDRESWRNELAFAFAILGLEKEALTISATPDPELLRLLGRPGDAVAAAQAHVAEDPARAEYRDDLGLTLAAAGDYDRARPIIEETWQRSGGLVTSAGSISANSAAALFAIRRDAGKESEVGKLLEALKDNVRRYREAGIMDARVDYEDGLATYLAGERESGLALIGKAAEDGFFILPNETYLQELYDDPGFAQIRAGQEARQKREREKFLAIVCTGNPYAAVWQPAEGTCEEFAAASAN